MIFINKYVDLHLHTNYSDGTLSPSDIIKLCADKNIKTISITDHDTTEGLPVAVNLAKELDINLINGIEMSALFSECDVHILGYGFDYNDLRLQNYLKNKVIDERYHRNMEIIHNFNRLGIFFESIDLNSSQIITRAHFSSELIKQGIVKDNDEAFEKYIGKKGLAYVPKKLPNARDVIELIIGLKGIVSLAHPILYGFDDDLFNSIKKLKDFGLEAVECYHSSYDEKYTCKLLEHCKSLDLLSTGGSDFHGENKKNTFIGQCTDGKFLLESTLSSFLEKVKIG